MGEDSSPPGRTRSLLCPSAQPGMAGLRLLGVIEGSGPGARVAYLNESVAVTDDLLASSHPLPPARIFRLAASCEESRCTHFDGHRCNLVTRIVNVLPAVVNELPVCLIRSTCRWHQQEGASACVRCPQVVTELHDPTDSLRRAALPE